MWNRHERAASLYQGKYLQYLYYEWVFSERRRLVQAYLNALQELAVYYLSTRSGKQAIEFSDRAISLDPLNEDLCCLSMWAYAVIGDRASAARVYAELRQRLHTELNTEPLPETTDLYQELMKNA